jgi:Fic family protein
MADFYNNITQMEPLLPLPCPRELHDLSVEVIRKSAQLSAMLHPLTRRGVRDLLREMNSYYSNLIEGHNTHPREIEKALREEYSHDSAERALQHESVAHIHVQKILEEKLKKEPSINICSADFLCWIHKEFYDRLPEEFRIVKAHNGEKVRIHPGQLREREVEVGRHLPPTFNALRAFIDRFSEVYEPSKLSAVDRVVAAAASHHRLAWIHPFLDGNGRVTRLYTDVYLVQSGVDGHGLWTMARGLARKRDDYMAALTWGDADRQNDYDGRGNLSQIGLIKFCQFFLETAIDQINFMSSLLELDGIQQRIQGFVEFQASLGELKPEARYILTDVLLRGEVARGEAARITGMPERSARIVLGQLQDKGLLVSDTPKSPVRLGFPTMAVGYYFPRLYPEGVEVSLRKKT